MLRIESLCANRGGIPVLHHVSLSIKENTVTALFGANGAGKTTLLSVLCGLIPAQSGTALWHGKNILSLSPHEILRLGIALVPEGRRIFPELSVTENLMVGGALLSGKELLSQTNAMLCMFPALKERKKAPAGILSGGEQQMLAMARALMTSPKLLLLDEPCMGLSPAMTNEIYSLIQRLQKSTSILLVEQNAHAALSISSQAHIITSGQIVLSGKSSALIDNASVISSYMGIRSSSKTLTTSTPRLFA